MGICEVRRAARRFKEIGGVRSSAAAFLAGIAGRHCGVPALMESIHRRARHIDK
jgi:hypothetical protein